LARPERLVLVDGTWLVFRAFFAIPTSFSTSEGLPTNATYGFATMFRKLFAGRRPERGAVVFDPPGPVQRELRFPAYKADRPPAPSDLVRQLASIDRVVAAHGFPVLRVPGFEADDVIGTLCRRAVEAGHEVLIVAGDKDFAQLIGPEVRMFDSMRDVTYDAELAYKRWGVRPDQVVDLLALMGDAVDNIPGVAGVGEKTAKSLLAEHGSLEGAYGALATLPNRVRQALQAGRDSALLSRELATIDTNVPVGVELDALRLPPPDPAAVDTLYRELEFRSLLSAQASEVEVAAHPVLDEAGARALLDGPGPVALHAVLDPGWGGVGTLVGLGLASGAGVGFAPTTVVTRLADRWADPGLSRYTHEVRGLEKAMRRLGLGLGPVDDTQLLSFLVEPTKCIPHRLDQVSREYLQRPLPDRKGVTGSGQAELRFAEAPLEAVAGWAGASAAAILDLGPLLWARLDELGLRTHYLERERPLADVLAAMEEAGIAVDRADLERLGVEFRARRDALEAEVHQLAGRPFNLGSTQQLATVLFEELKLPVIKKNKTGYSTDAEVLEVLARQHPLPARLLEHRALAKLINTYTDVLAASVDATTGRIHATFNQTVGLSGRLISTDPDLQRTPVRTPEGKRIRAAFVAPPGFRILSADWSQIELRVLAHFAQDPRLIEAFAQDLDVHRQTAAALFGVAPELVTGPQRTVGKTINFATIYGQGATALAQILGVPRKEAQAYIDGFFTTYAGVASWLARTVEQAARDGYVTTLLGRRRWIPELRSLSPMDRQAGERIAANTPIQGSAADLCKLAMLDLHGRLRGSGARLLLQVHDELVLEVPEAEVDATRDAVVAAMTHPWPLDVPLVVNVGVGRSWAEAH